MHLVRAQSINPRSHYQPKSFSCSKNVGQTRTDVNIALRHATCLHLTSSNDQGLINSRRLKLVTSGYHHGRLITRWRERAYRICRLWVIMAKHRIEVDCALHRATCLTYIIIVLFICVICCMPSTNNENTDLVCEKSSSSPVQSKSCFPLRRHILT